VIVSSATLDATSFFEYFKDPRLSDEPIIVSLEGRMYPVEVAYLAEPTPDYVRMAARTSWNINLQVLSNSSNSFCLLFNFSIALARSR
jgi:ATP-dependent RNA helicase DDX35